MKTSCIIYATAFLFFGSPLNTGFCQVYKYQDEKGNWCFTDSPTSIPKDAEIEELRESEPVIDLRANMAERFPPKNALEEARNATVMVVSSKGVGTGFFVNQRGYIITNRHVADEADGVYTIIFIDQSKYTIYGADLSDKYDLALLRLIGYRSPCIEQGDARELGIGDSLFAIGMPKTLMHSVTSGIFSSYRVLDDGVKYIQTNAQINLGNSGGPLVTQQGRVVGVNTLKRADTEGIGFAIPIDLVIAEFRRYLAN